MQAWGLAWPQHPCLSSHKLVTERGLLEASAVNFNSCLAQPRVYPYSRRKHLARDCGEQGPPARLLLAADPEGSYLGGGGGAEPS